MLPTSHPRFRRPSAVCLAAFAAGSLQIPHHAFGEWGGVGGHSPNDPQVLNPTGYDDDGDGLPSLWEEGNGFNTLNPADALSDFDMDGLTALQEYQLHTATSGLFGNSYGKWSMTAVAAPTGFTPAPQVTVVEVASNGIILARVSGKLTGQTTTTNFPYIWTPSTGTWQRIPAPAAFPAITQMEPLDVNSSGQVVGHFNSAGTRGFIWTPDPWGGTTSVYDLDSGGVILRGLPTRISDSGFVVGRVSSMGGRTFAARPDQSEITFSGWTSPIFKDVNNSGEFMGTVFNPLTSKTEQFIATEGSPIFLTGISADDVQGSGGPWGSVPDVDVAQIVWDTGYPRQGTVIDRTTGGVVEFSGGIGSEPFWKSPFTTDGSTPLWYTMPNFHAPVVGTMNGWGEFVGSYTWEMGESYLDSYGIPVGSGLTNTGSFFFDGKYHFTEAGSPVIGVSNEPRVLLGPAPFSLWCGAKVAHIGGLIPSGYPTSFSSARISEGGDIVLQQYSSTPFYILKLSQDADGDGMPDDWEKYHNLDPASAGDADGDQDGDGYSTLIEFQYRTNPNVPTAQKNGRMIDLYPDVDDDEDGLPDVWEWTHGLYHDPSQDGDADKDRDGLTNSQELQLGLEPDNWDTDSDGVSDGDEVEVNFTNPLTAVDADQDSIPDDLELHLSKQFLSVQPSPSVWGAKYPGLVAGNLDPSFAYTGENLTAAQLSEFLRANIPSASGYLVEPFCRANRIYTWHKPANGSLPAENSGFYYHGVHPRETQEDIPTFSFSLAALSTHMLGRIGGVAWLDMVSNERGGTTTEWYDSWVKFDSLAISGITQEASGNYTIYRGHVIQNKFQLSATRADHPGLLKKYFKVTRKHPSYTQAAVDTDLGDFVSAEEFTIEIPKGKFFSEWYEFDVEMVDGEYRSSCLLPMEVAVDADRDGEIVFDGTDQTTPVRPFRFWINNDQDDVEVEEPFAVDENERDFLDSTIKTKRDLEDFSRIRLSVGLPLNQLRNGSYKVGLRFKGAGAQTPGIRIWPNESASGQNSYLDHDAAAGSQIAKQAFGETYNGTVFIPASYWADRGDTEAHLIFEGTKKGTGELVVVVKKDGHPEIDTASLHIKLMDVREMFQRARVVSSASDIPHPWVDDSPSAQTAVADPWDWPYSEDPEVEDISAIYVHGWRVQYNECVSRAATSYKRLWHQGFKGRFYSFRWATLSADDSNLWGAHTYNASEYRAWLCGPALAEWVNNLPGEGPRGIFAHSMGNIVVGSALRAGMNVERYALCNAAVSSMAYHSSPGLRNDPSTGLPWEKIWSNQIPRKTPDTDPLLPVREAYGLSEKFGAGVAGMPTMINFYLKEDSALKWWVDNNLDYKPESALGYYYHETPIAPNLSYKIFQIQTGGGLREVTSPPEALGYVTKSLTRTAGADSRTAGSINASVNMDDWGVGANHSGFGHTHSAQWIWNNQSTSHFWKKLCEELELTD